jgi:hypothetical protein
MEEKEMDNKDYEQISREMVDKDYEKISLERDLSNANRELELNSGQMESMNLKRGFLVREIELVKAQTKLAMKNWKLIKPTWAFEDDPEYVELGRQFAQLNFEKKMFEYNNALEQTDRLIESIKEQYKSVAEHRDNIIIKLEKIGE